MCAFSRISCKFAIGSTISIGQFTNSINRLSDIGKIPYQCITKIDAIWPYKTFEEKEPTTPHPSPSACGINSPVK